MNKEDIERLDFIDIAGISNVLYRKETTDLNCLKEVLEQKCYQSKKHNITVEAGEHWLDLGGNIGAFGLFCFINGSKVTSYEPDKDCFEIMRQNYETNSNDLGYDIHNYAVTNSLEKELVFYRGSKETDRYRTSIMPNKKSSKIILKNRHGGAIQNQTFDGIKIDIEGSEFGLIEDGLLPKSNKLVMEYHITKDKSMANFHKRMDILRDLYKNVYYMPSLDRFDRNGQYPGFFDRIIHCSN